MVAAEPWDDAISPKSDLPFATAFMLHDERLETPSPVEPLVNHSCPIAAWIPFLGAR